MSGFEGFEGPTSRITGVTRSALYARNGGYGMGINGLGFLIGTGFGVDRGGTVGFAFKNWSDQAWGGEVTLCQMYNSLTGVRKAQLSITAQKQLVIYSYDRPQGGLVKRAISTRSLKDDAWHYLELNWSSGGGDTCEIPSDGTVAAAINGQTVCSFTGSTDLCPEDDPDPYHPKRFVDNFKLGVLGGFLNEERHMGFDDVYAGTVVGFIGDAQAFEVQLESDLLTEWTPSSGSSHFAMVDDDPADDATTYNKHTEIGYKSDSFEVVDIPGQPGLGGVVLGVQLSARMRKTRTSIWRYQPWIYVDPYICYQNGAALTFDVWTEMPTKVFWQAPGPPDETGHIIGHAWTWEEVQAIQVGYVAWPPNGFIEGSYLGDNYPVVFVE